MTASPLSAFECLLVHIQQPISVHIKSYHRTYSPSLPATHLFSFLPLPSKLSLRRVCPTTKAWVDSADPSVFSNLKVLSPLNTFSTEELLALHSTSAQCEHLLVTVSQYIPAPKPTDAIPLPPFPRLKHLSLTAPNHDPFKRLLSFRLALQSANIPLLTRLTINNPSFPGILALRWGTFTSFGDAGSTGASMWHALQELNIQAVGWWEDKPREKGDHSSYGAERSEREAQKARRRKEDWRTCTRVLHDWLHSFAAAGQLHTFRFEWANGEGPNPVLLDELVSSDGKKEWFSAPAVRWSGLTQLWLGNVVVSLVDVRLLKERMEGLEKLVVRPECLHSGLGGRKLVADGKTWAELLVVGRRAGEWSELVADSFSAPSSLAAAARGSYDERILAEDRESMVLPFVLDLSPEEEMGL